MKLEFLNHSASSSKQDHEVRDSLARSHAAKFAHEKRQKATASAHTPLGKPVRSYAAFAALGYITDAFVDQLNPSSVGVGDVTAIAPTSTATDDEGIATDNYGSQTTAITLLSAKNVLIRGRSDPFDTFAIPIDPRVHDILMYFKNTTLFQRHGVNAKTWALNQGAITDWQIATKYLEDVGLAYALLAQISSIIALESKSVSQQYRQLSRKYSRQSCTDLRVYLENNQEEWDSLRTWRHISLLQHIELYGPNLEAAMLHGKMLQPLDNHRVTHKKGIEPRKLIHSLYVDVHMAIIFLVRPNFEPSKELIEQFSEYSAAVYRDISLMSDSSMMRHLDEQVSDQRLRNIFLRWEQCRMITSFYGRRLWTFTTQILNINDFLDIEEKLLNTRLDPTRRTFLHTQAYISLAALYFIRVTTIPEHFTTRAHMTFHTNLVRRLQYHLEVSNDTSGKGSHQYSRARLWALFVGAHSEHQAAALQLQLLPRYISPDWFKAHFAQQVKLCGLLKWAEVRTVLEGFMYCDIKPDPSIWYLELIFSDLW